MKEYTRNLAVGTTVIGALAILAAMIVIFTGVPDMLHTGYRIHITAPTTYDARVGDPVYLSGIRVGRLTDVRFADPERPTGGVVFSARIDHGVQLPGDAKAYIFTRGLAANAYIQIASSGDFQPDGDGRPLAHLPTDGSATIESVHKGSGLLPDELTPALANLSELAANLNKLVAPPEDPNAPDATTGAAASAPAGDGDQTLRGTIGKINRTLDALHTVLGDGDNQANLKTSMANLADATGKANEAMDALKAFAAEARGVASDARTVTTRASQTMEEVSLTAKTATRRVDELAGKLIENSEDLSKLLATINRTATELEKGDGTLGKMINDPKLYNNLVDATNQMTVVLKDFQELVQAWKQRGVEIKLK